MSQEQTIALIAAATPFVISLAGVLFKWLVAKLPQSKQATALQLVQIGVHAAEQVGAGQSGAAKKKIAEDFINDSLAALGLKVNPALINAAIEAMVFNLNPSPAQSLDGSNHNG
jgi:hypothetical protein